MRYIGKVHSFEPEGHGSLRAINGTRFSFEDLRTDAYFQEGDLVTFRDERQGLQGLLGPLAVDVQHVV